MERSSLAELAREKKAVKQFWQRVAAFPQANLTAAAIVLADVPRFGGESAGLVRWARLTMERAA